MPRSLRSQSQTLFWWKFSGQVIDQKEEHCTGIVFLLQKCGYTSDTEVRLVIRFRIGRDSPYYLGIRKNCTCSVKNKFYSVWSMFFPPFFSSNKYVSLSRICLTCHRNNSLYNSCLGRESLKFKHNLFQLYR